MNAAANESGLYRAGSLIPGDYRLEVEAEGFEKLVRGPIALQVGQVVSVDLTLQLGKASETITVTEAAPLTESQTSTVSQVVNRQMLTGLPLPNRAASSLAALAPGVVWAAAEGTTSAHAAASATPAASARENLGVMG